MTLKKNDSDNYESINVKLDKYEHPNAFENKVQELVDSGLNRKEAEKEVENKGIELELYYSPFQGLFSIEAEAVECGDIYNPYDGELMEESD